MYVCMYLSGQSICYAGPDLCYAAVTPEIKLNAGLRAHTNIYQQIASTTNKYQVLPGTINSDENLKKTNENQ